MIGHSIAFLIAYVYSVIVIMYINTAWFELGDVKFGKGGWEIYWPVWSILYAPLAICALIAVWTSPLPAASARGMLWMFLPILIIAMELHFVSDFDDSPGVWLGKIIAVWFGIGALFVWLTRRRGGFGGRIG
jgi:hypothetical protein